MSEERWVFVAPIDGLTMTKAVNFEINVDGIVFVSSSRLPRIRKRLGFPRVLSNYPIIRHRHDFFECAETFAVFQVRNDPKAAILASLNKVHDALLLLGSSQLGYTKRKLACRPRLHRIAGDCMLRVGFFHASSNAWSQRDWRLGSPMPLVLDQTWLRYHRRLYFMKLLELLDTRSRIAIDWRGRLRRASLLIGRSQDSMHMGQAFLWNMIAIETLLFKQDNEIRPKEVLPKRIEAMLGWVGFWEDEDYSSKIKNAYGKRCTMVHEGNLDCISREDVHFSDMLVFNLMNNLVRHSRVFGNIDAVIRFSKEVEAERTLKVRPRVQPKTLEFIHKRFDENSFLEI